MNWLKLIVILVKLSFRVSLCICQMWMGLFGHTSHKFCIIFWAADFRFTVIHYSFQLSHLCHRGLWSEIIRGASWDSGLQHKSQRFWLIRWARKELRMSEWGQEKVQEHMRVQEGGFGNWFWAQFMFCNLYYHHFTLLSLSLGYETVNKIHSLSQCNHSIWRGHPTLTWHCVLNHALFLEHTSFYNSRDM